MKRKDANVGASSNPSSPEILNLDFKGLYTYPNQFSEIPAGALSSCANVIIDAPGIVDSRRGYTQYSAGYSIGTHGLSFGNISGLTVEHCDNNAIYIDTNGDGSVMTALSGSYIVPDVSNAESRVRFQNINQNLFFTTANGVYKMASSSTTPVLAGGPEALNGSGVTTGASGWMAVTSNIAYRVVWQYTDIHGQLIQGPASERIVIANTSGITQNVILTFNIPVGIDATWQAYVYRSNISADLASPPDDQCQLVYTLTPSSGQLTARVVTITDSLPDNQKGQTIYTSVEGAQNNNYRPPQCQDLSLFKGSAFYANTIYNQRFLLNLISSTLLVNGDTITFSRNGSTLFTITGGATENTSTGTFAIATVGTAAQMIFATANSIINVINLYAANTSIYAVYSNALDQSPGNMVFSDIQSKQNAFSVVCSRTGNVFSPIIPSSGVTSVNSSNNNAGPNQIAFSKYLQPEAVPLGNTLVAGSSNYPILRILPLQQSLIIIKSDGVFRITGTSTANFAVSPLDVQLKIAAINTCQVLNNMIYAFTEQGCVQITDSGSVNIISLPIQNDLLKLISPNYTNFKSATWALAYPSDHRYIISTVSNAADVYANVQYCYNYVTSSWTRWTQNWTAGYINPTNGVMYASNYASAGTVLYKERKSITDDDYYDEQWGVIISAVNVNVITLTYVTNVVIGQTLTQGALRSLIVSIDAVNNTVTLQDLETKSWTLSAAYVTNPIYVEFQISPLSAGNPTRVKQFTELSIITLSETTSNITTSFTNDYGKASVLYPLLSGSGASNFGELPFGTSIFGGSGSSVLERTRMYIPGNVQKSNWIEIMIEVNQSFKKVSFSGIQIIFRWLTSRQRR